jgi:hypothetical protein
MERGGKLTLKSPTYPRIQSACRLIQIAQGGGKRFQDNRFDLRRGPETAAHLKVIYDRSADTVAGRTGWYGATRLEHLLAGML